MRKALGKAICRAGILSVAAAGVALVAPAIAQANPTCGSVVTGTVTLTGNMSCNPNNFGGGPGGNSGAALYVGASHTTINLNGFTIYNNSGSSSNAPVAIDNAGDWNGNAPGSGGTSGPGSGFNHVTVENGNIYFAWVGVYEVSASHPTLSNLHIGASYSDGIELYKSNAGTVNNVTSGFKYGTFVPFGKFPAGNGGAGIVSGRDLNITITGSAFDYNYGGGAYSGYIGTDTGFTWNKDKFNQNYYGGLFIDSPGAPYLIENSKANNNDGDGFEVYDNTFKTTKFKNNTSKNNTGWGYWADLQAGGTNNAYSNDGAGGCHKVKGCHLV
jgi:hypothetical protein